MDTDEIAKSLLGNLGLLGATLGVVAAIRGGNPKRNTGICQSCGGRGVKQCTLCYGKGYLNSPGYVNFADPRHRRLCQRCDGSKTVACTACGSPGRESPERPSNDQGHVHPMKDSADRRGLNPAMRRDNRNMPRLNDRRIQRQTPSEQQDDEF